MRLTVQWQDRSREPHAGQFYMLRAWAADATPILSRPISVDDFDNQTGALTFLYQVKGEGTHKLAALKKDDTLTVTGPCGNGFDTAALAGQYKRIAVVGGGIGVPPVLCLARELAEAGLAVDACVGSATAAKLVGVEDFEALGAGEVCVATDDGTAGLHGFCTESAAELLSSHEYDYVATCGPGVMMSKVAASAAEAGVYCEASLERMMSCGFGACSTCNVETTDGMQGACMCGPVFDATKVVVW